MYSIESTFSQNHLTAGHNRVNLQLPRLRRNRANPVSRLGTDLGTFPRSFQYGRVFMRLLEPSVSVDIFGVNQS